MVHYGLWLSQGAYWGHQTEAAFYPGSEGQPGSQLEPQPASAWWSESQSAPFNNNSMMIEKKDKIIMQKETHAKLYSS